MKRSANERLEKFEYVVRGTSVRYIQARSAFTAAELDRFIKSSGCVDVSVNQSCGMDQAALEEALKSRFARRLSVVMDSVSLAGLEGNDRIESVYLGGSLDRPVDFASARSLRSLNLIWQQNAIGLDRMHGLRDLVLREFRGEPGELSRLDFLHGLSLIQPNIADLAFLESFHRLRKLEIAYARRLADFTGVLRIAPTLEELELDHLPKIDGFEKIIGQLPALKRLKISKCRAMQSLDFVRKLPKLEFISFVDTDVISGDITPCEGIPYVGFLDKRHFNCTWDAEKERLIRKESKSPSRSPRTAARAARRRI